MLWLELPTNTHGLDDRRNVQCAPITVNQKIKDRNFILDHFLGWNKFPKWCVTRFVYHCFFYVTNQTDKKGQKGIKNGGDFQEIEKKDNDFITVLHYTNIQYIFNVMSKTVNLYNSMYCTLLPVEALLECIIDWTRLKRAVSRDFRFIKKLHLGPYEQAKTISDIIFAKIFAKTCVHIVSVVKDYADTVFALSTTTRTSCQRSHCQ